MRTPKDCVLVFYPNALCLKVRVKHGFDWQVVNSGEVIGKGWTARSAWNNADNRIRAEKFTSNTEHISAAFDIREGKKTPADFGI